MLPFVGFKIPQIILMSVDLPDPFAPIIPNISPGSTDRDMLSRTLLVPYEKLISFIFSKITSGEIL